MRNLRNMNSPSDEKEIFITYQAKITQPLFFYFMICYCYKYMHMYLHLSYGRSCVGLPVCLIFLFSFSFFVRFIVHIIRLQGQQYVINIYSHQSVCLKMRPQSDFNLFYFVRSTRDLRSKPYLGMAMGWGGVGKAYPIPHPLEIFASIP